VRRLALDRLRVFIEVLARIAVRVTPDQAKKIFTKGLAFGKMSEFQNIWLTDVLNDLVEYTFSNISKTHQHEMLMETLSFPLPSETRLEHYVNHRPNPVIKFPASRSTNPALDRRIDEIIDNILPCTPKSAPALLRLLPLLNAGFLTCTECQKIGEKYGVPPLTINYCPIQVCFRMFFLLFPHRILQRQEAPSDGVFLRPVKIVFLIDFFY